MNKRERITFVVIFCIAILSTIIFLQPHYSIDTIEFMQNGYENYVTSKFLVDGRIFSALLLGVVIAMPMQYIIPIMHILGILISCITTMYVRKILIEYNHKNAILATIIAYITVFNFMYIDVFTYIEFPIIAISILLYIIASKLLVEQKKGYLLKSTGLVMIAMFCYQGTISTFIATTFVLSIIENKKINKTILLDMSKVIVICLITVIVNYGFTMLAGGTQRINFRFIENVKNGFITLFFLIFNSGNQYIPFLQLAFTIIIISYCLFKHHNIRNIIWIYMASMFAVLPILSITQGTLLKFQWGRIYFSIGALIGYIFMYLYCNGNWMEKEKFLKIVIMLYLISLLFTYVEYTYFYMVGQGIDKKLITQIDSVISEYEKNNNVSIKKYAYRIRSDSKTWSIESILNNNYTDRKLCTIYTGRRTQIMRAELFKIYSNREIEITIFEDEIYEKYFVNRELNEISEENFVFIDDTVYIVF